jgi:hypothetical protein
LLLPFPSSTRNATALPFSGRSGQHQLLQSLPAARYR